MTTTGTLSPPTGEKSGSDPRVAGLMVVGAMVALMWVVEIVDALGADNLDYDFGIRPRAVGGLDGVLFSPFLHGSWSHLIGNTIPFVILGGLIALGGLARVVAVSATVGIVGGVGVWLFASENSVHIGASGLVFGYAGYLVARGFFTRSLLHFAVGAIVAAVWGTTLLSGLIPQDGISWQGHLFGGLGGIVAARLLSPTKAEEPTPRAATFG
jgi:membrane associated rhomboid family serine protease